MKENKKGDKTSRTEMVSLVAGLTRSGPSGKEYIQPCLVEG